MNGSGDGRAPSNLDSHVPSQFPGVFPSTFAAPYRPPGLATEYYGDQGESVADQPGVRPQPPSIIHTADQAHLHEPTIEAAPPPEPSSMGQTGAAASFFANTSDVDTAAPAPTGEMYKPSMRPSKHSSSGASPRASPGPSGRPTSFPGNTGVAGAAAMGAAGGFASEYYNASSAPPPGQGGFYTSPISNTHDATYTSTANTSSTRPTRPSQQHSGSNSALYGAAAAGLAAGAGAHYLGHQYSGQGSHAGHGQQHSSGTLNSSMGMAHRRKRRGPLGKLANFFKDPEGVAEFEVYSEAIGVCKYCFDPRSSPKDAPRKHNHSRRNSGGRYGSNTRVEKVYRQQSSDEEKRRKSNSKKPWIAGGLAGYALAKLGENVLNNKDFDDTYSVRTGQLNESQLSLAKTERRSSSRKEKSFSQEGAPLHRSSSHRSAKTGIRKDKVTGELYEERKSQHRRSSSSTASSDSHHAIGRGAAMSAGTVASERHDRRRRKRSRSPKKRYYHKRVSPRHSYVDLSNTAPGGPGIGSFFSSPSANRRKGKKAKGIFGFSNVSSSSSDEDLAFGEGSVRRKNSKREDHRRKDNDNVDSAILGLAATGVALAAASSRKESKKRQNADLTAGKERRDHGSRASEQRRSHAKRSSSSNEENSAWEDASDDESSNDSALAYGSKLSARQSRESLGSSDGTSKWAWRWNRGKRDNPKNSPEHETHSMPAAEGAALVAAASAYGRSGLTESSARLPAMQQLHPIPTSDPGVFDVARHGSMAFSPMTTIPPSMTTATVPLHHPQPVMPVSPAIYTTSASSSAPIYSSISPAVPFSCDQMDSTMKEFTDRPDDTRHNNDAGGRRGRESSPAHSSVSKDVAQEKPRRRASTRDQSSSVKFDLTEEQTERERRSHDRNRRRSGRVSDIEQDPKKDSAEKRRTREQEIEQELERLYQEDRRQSSEGRTRHDDYAVPVAGVVAAAAIANSSSTKDEERSTGEGSRGRQPLHKSQRLPSSDEVAAEEMNESDRRRRRPAQKAAIRIRTDPSPIRHDDYAAYFTPPELQGKLKEHNDAADRRHTPEPISPVSPEVIEIVPKGGSSPSSPSSPRSAGFKFDPFNYTPFGNRRRDDASAQSWPVPRLDLIEPTPPHSARGSVRGAMSPIPPASPEPIQTPEQKPQRSRSDARVSWGEHETHEFDVVTPLDDLAEFRDDKREQQHHTQVEDREMKPVIAEVGPRESVPANDRDANKKDSHGYGHDLEFAAALAAGAQEAGFDPSVVIDDPTYHRRDSPPGSEDKGVYQSPFAQTASDLGTFDNRSVPSPIGFVEGELPPTPKAEQFQTPRGEVVDGADGINGASESKLHKKERKRLEKASKCDIKVSVPTASETGPPKSASRELELGSSEMLDNGQQSISGGFNVFDYLDKHETPDAKETVKPSRSEDAAGEYIPVSADGGSTAQSARESGTEGEIADEDNDPPRRTPQEKPRRSSTRDSDGFYDDRSVISTPANRKDSVKGKKSRRRSRREDDVQDDTGSVVSMPADLKNDKDSRRNSKDKKSGGIFGFFSSSKSETTSKDHVDDEGRSTREESEASKKKGKRKSKDKDIDDGAPARKRSRSGSRSAARQSERRQSPEVEFLSSEEAPERRSRDTAIESEEKSFLGERPEVPTVSDGASGSITERKRAEDASAATPSSTSIEPQTSTSALRTSSTSPMIAAREIQGPMTSVQDLASTSQVEQTRTRRLSLLQTTDLSNTQLTTSSPTAVPIHFRRLPLSPGVARSASVGTADAASLPSSPLMPRPRQGRPSSTEFRSKEFRPLWLVERHGASKIEQTEIEQSYPSLPSSRTSSTHPSLENLRGGQDFEDVFSPDEASSQPFAHRRSNSYPYWHDERPKSPDFLDSRTATPTATEFPKEVKKEKPKYEFHSPSELLQDPATLHEQPGTASPPLSPMHLPRALTSEPSDVECLPALPDSRPSSPLSVEGRRDHESLSRGVGLDISSHPAAIAISEATKSEDPPAKTATRDDELETPYLSAAEDGPIESSPMYSIGELKKPDSPVLGKGLGFSSTPLEGPSSRAIDAPSIEEPETETFVLQPVSSKKSKRDKKKNKRQSLNLAASPTDQPDQTREILTSQAEDIPRSISVPSPLPAMREEPTTAQLDIPISRDLRLSNEGVDNPGSPQSPLQPPVITDSSEQQKTPSRANAISIDEDFKVAQSTVSKSPPKSPKTTAVAIPLDRQEAADIEYASADYQTPLSPLAEAFERARAARGVPVSTTQDDILSVLEQSEDYILPDTLETIKESSHEASQEATPEASKEASQEGSRVDLSALNKAADMTLTTEEPIAADIWKTPSKSKSKKDKKAKKSKGVVDLSVNNSQSEEQAGIDKTQMHISPSDNFSRSMPVDQQQEQTSNIPQFPDFSRGDFLAPIAAEPASQRFSDPVPEPIKGDLADDPTRRALTTVGEQVQNADLVVQQDLETDRDPSQQIPPTRDVETTREVLNPAKQLFGQVLAQLKSRPERAAITNDRGRHFNEQAAQDKAQEPSTVFQEPGDQKEAEEISWTPTLKKGKKKKEGQFQQMDTDADATKDNILATGPVEEEADIWATTSKKGKKDKKKGKKTSIAAADLVKEAGNDTLPTSPPVVVREPKSADIGPEKEAVVIVTEEPSSERSVIAEHTAEPSLEPKEERADAMEQAIELFAPTLKATSTSTAANLAGTTESEPSAVLEEQVDEFAWAPTKKGKKDKKKQRKAAIAEDTIDDVDITPSQGAEPSSIAPEAPFARLNQEDNFATLKPLDELQSLPKEEIAQDDMLEARALVSPDVQAEPPYRSTPNDAPRNAEDYLPVGEQSFPIEEQSFPLRITTAEDADRAILENPTISEEEALQISKALYPESANQLSTELSDHSSAELERAMSPRNVPLPDDDFQEAYVAEVEPSLADQADQAEESAWDPAPKKSKRDKKKKKQFASEQEMSTSVAEPAEQLTTFPTVVSVGEAAESVEVSREQVVGPKGDAEESLTPVESASIGDDRPKLPVRAPEDQVSQGAPDALQEEPEEFQWAMPGKTKEGKKDKKDKKVKKKRAIVPKVTTPPAVFEESEEHPTTVDKGQQAGTETDPEQSRAVPEVDLVPEVKLVADAKAASGVEPALEVESAPGVALARKVESPSDIPAIPYVEAFPAVETTSLTKDIIEVSDTQTSEHAEEAWGFPTQKSKKKNKKNAEISPRAEIPPTTIEESGDHPTDVAMGEHTGIGIIPTQTTEPPEVEPVPSTKETGEVSQAQIAEPAEVAWDFPVKKSKKKDKRKGKDMSREEIPPTTIERSKEHPTDVGQREQTSMEMDPIQTMEPLETEPATLPKAVDESSQNETAQPVEEAWDFSTKKSKKKDKKKRSSVFAEVGTTPCSMSGVEPEPTEGTEIPDTNKQSINQSAAEDAWAPPSKKGKKGKNTRGSLMATEEFSSTSSPADTGEASGSIPATIATSEPLTNVVDDNTKPAIDTEEWGFPSKKSKKDKKKRGSLGTPRETSPARSAIPDVARENTGSTGTSDHIPDSKEEEKEQPPVPAQADPPLPASLGITDAEKSVDTTIWKVASDSAIEHPDKSEAADEVEEWAFTTKKSKKNRKEKKKGALATLDETSESPSSALADAEIHPKPGLQHFLTDFQPESEKLDRQMKALQPAAGLPFSPVAAAQEADEAYGMARDGDNVTSDTINRTIAEEIKQDVQAEQASILPSPPVVGIEEAYETSRISNDGDNLTDDIVKHAVGEEIKRDVQVEQASVLQATDDEADRKPRELGTVRASSPKKEELDSSATDAPNESSLFNLDVTNQEITEQIAGDFIAEQASVLPQPDQGAIEALPLPMSVTGDGHLPCATKSPTVMEQDEMVGKLDNGGVDYGEAIEASVTPSRKTSPEIPPVFGQQKPSEEAETVPATKYGAVDVAGETPIAEVERNIFPEEYFQAEQEDLSWLPSTKKNKKEKKRKQKSALEQADTAEATERETKAASIERPPSPIKEIIISDVVAEKPVMQEELVKSTAQDESGKLRDGLQDVEEIKKPLSEPEARAVVRDTAAVVVESEDLPQDTHADDISPQTDFSKKLSSTEIPGDNFARTVGQRDIGNEAEATVLTTPQKDADQPVSTKYVPVERPPETVEEETWGFTVTKKNKKGKKAKGGRRASEFEVSEVEPQVDPSQSTKISRSSSMPGGFDEKPVDEPSISVATAEADQVIPEVREQSPVKDDHHNEDEWALPGKTGKKAKKGKKGKGPGATGMFEIDQTTKPPLEPVPDPVSAASSGQNERGLTQTEDEGAQTTEIVPEALQVPDTTESAQREEEPDKFVQIPTRKGKSKKDKKKRQQSSWDAEPDSNTAPDISVSSRKELAAATSDSTFSTTAGLGLTAAVTATALAVKRSDHNKEPASYFPEVEPVHSLEREGSISDQAAQSHDQPAILVEAAESGKETEATPTDLNESQYNPPTTQEMKQLPGPKLVVEHEAVVGSGRNRDSGVQLSEQGIRPEDSNRAIFRDSGYIPSPITRPGWDETSSRSEAERPPRPLTPTSSSEDLKKEAGRLSTRSSAPHQDVERSQAAFTTLEGEPHREPSPVDSTTKDRSSGLFDSSPSNRFDTIEKESPSPIKHSEFQSAVLKSPTPRRNIKVQPDTQDQAPTLTSNMDDLSKEIDHPRDILPAELYQSIFGPPASHDALERTLSPPKTPLHTISEDARENEKGPFLRRHISPSHIASPARSHTSTARSPTPNTEGRSTPDIQPAQKKLRRSHGSGDIRRASLGSEHSEGHDRLLSPAPDSERSFSRKTSPRPTHGNFVTAAAAVGAAGLGAAVLQPRSRDDLSTKDTKSLGNEDLKPTTSKQRRARQLGAEGLPSSSTYDPVNDKGREVVRDMADVYVSADCLFTFPLTPREVQS